jgi:nucleoside-diphosphate-sugar epimerase
MKVLILGGRRYLGPRLVQRLIECNHEPVLFNRGRTNAPLPTAVPVREFHGDRRSEADLVSLLKRESFDAVVDTLAFDASDAELAIRVFAHYVTRYVVISSVACYGRLRCVPADENHPYVDDQTAFPLAANNYAAGKRDMEQVFLAAHRNGNFPVVVIRPSVCYGYGRLLSVWGYSNRHVSRIRAGKPVIVPDSGEALIQPLFIDDEADIIERALVADEAIGEAFNCAGPVAMPLWQYFQSYSASLGMKVNVAEVPAAFLQGFDPVLCARAAQNLIFNHAYDVSKLGRLLRFEHQFSLEDGLRHTIEFQDRWGLVEPTGDDPDDWLINAQCCKNVTFLEERGMALRIEKGYRPLEQSALVNWAPDHFRPSRSSA